MRTMGVAATGFVLFFLACSSGGGGDAAEGGATQPGAPKRGTRLAPQFRETSDGLSDYHTMIDTGLGDTACSPLRAGDGVIRCVPQDLGVTTAYSSEFFSDASCQSAVAASSKGCAKPVFALIANQATSCNEVDDVYAVGAEHTGQIYKGQGPSDCTPATADARRSYWLLGAKRAATDFVKLTQRIETIAGGVGVAMYDGDDGSSFPQYQLVDVARAKGCHQGKAVDGKTRCIPTNSGFVNGFVDDMCTKPAALVNPPGCDPLYDSKNATTNTPANDGTEQVFELGAKQLTKDTFRGDPVTCDGPFAGTADVYERGPEIAAATFPELVVAEAGGTRIIAGRLSAAGVVLPPNTGFFDKMLDLKCNFMASADGKERCLPQGAAQVYSDDQCTVRVVVHQAAQPLPKYAIGFAAGACPRPLHVYPVGAEVMPKPAKLWDDFSGTCIESSPPGSASVYALGAETAPATFVESTLVTR